MDDSLETPRALPPKAPLSDQQLEENDQQSSDDEDGGLDWTKLVSEIINCSNVINLHLVWAGLLQQDQQSPGEAKKNLNRGRAVAQTSSYMYWTAPGRLCWILYVQQERSLGVLIPYAEIHHPVLRNQRASVYLVKL